MIPKKSQKSRAMSQASMIHKKKSKVKNNDSKLVLSCSTIIIREKQTAKHRNKYLNSFIDFYT